MKFTIGDLVACLGYTYSKFVRDGDRGRVTAVYPAPDYPHVDHRYDIQFILPSNAADGSTYSLEEKYLSRAREVDLGALQSARLYPADSLGRSILVVEIKLPTDNK